MKTINNILKILLFSIVILNNNLFAMNVPLVDPNNLTNDSKDPIKIKSVIPIIFFNRFRNNQTQDTLNETIRQSVLFFSSENKKLDTFATNWDAIQKSSKELDQVIAERSNAIFNKVFTLSNNPSINFASMFNNIVKKFQDSVKCEAFLSEIVSKLLNIKIPTAQGLDFSDDINKDVEHLNGKFQGFFNEIHKAFSIKFAKCKDQELSDLIRKIKADTNKKDEIIKYYLKECLKNVEPCITKFIFNNSSLPNCLEIIFKEQQHTQAQIENAIKQIYISNKNIDNNIVNDMANIVYDMLYVENVYDKQKKFILQDIYKETKLSLDILYNAINEINISKNDTYLLDQKNFICLAINFISKDDVLNNAQNHIEENLKRYINSYSKCFLSEKKEDIKIILLCFDICCQNSYKIEDLIKIHNQFCKCIGQNTEIVCFVSKDLKDLIKNNIEYDKIQTLTKHPEILCLDSSLKDSKFKRKNANIIDFISISNKILLSQANEKTKLPFVFSFQKDHLTNPDIRELANSKTNYLYSITGCHFTQQQNNPIFHLEDPKRDIQDLKITESQILKHINGISCIILHLSGAPDKFSTCLSPEYINCIGDIILNTLNNIFKTNKTEDTAIFWDNISQSFILETFFSKDITIQVKTVYPILTFAISHDEQIKECDEKYKQIAIEINKLKTLLCNLPEKFINKMSKFQDPSSYIQMVKIVLFCAEYKLPFSEANITTLGKILTYKKNNETCTKKRSRKKNTLQMAHLILKSIPHLTKSAQLNASIELEELPLYKNIIDCTWIYQTQLLNSLLHKNIGKNLDELGKMDSQQLIDSLDLDINSTTNLDTIINNLNQLSDIKNITTKDNFICVTFKINNGTIDFPVYFAMK